MLRSHFCCLLALGLLSSDASTLFGQSQNDNRQGAKYHLAMGRTYNQHAGDHLRILKKVAAAGKTVPGDVVAEHVVAARTNVQAAKNSFAKLGSAASDKPGVAKQIAQLQQQLNNVSEQLKQFEVQTTQEIADSSKVMTQTAALTEQLGAIDAAARQTDDDFYDMDSAKYYSTGEGHFVD